MTDILLDVIIIGPMQSGKTNFMRRFIHGQSFNPDISPATDYGKDLPNIFDSKKAVIIPKVLSGNKCVNFRIWDFHRTMK